MGPDIRFGDLATLLPDGLKIYCTYAQLYKYNKYYIRIVGVRLSIKPTSNFSVQEKLSGE